MAPGSNPMEAAMRARSETLGQEVEVADTRNLLSIVMESTTHYCDYSLTALGLNANSQLSLLRNALPDPNLLLTCSARK